MWSRAVIAWWFAVGCGSHGEPSAPRAAQDLEDTRCVLRISQRGTLADGERMSRADAVAYCKRMPGGAVVVIDESPTFKWDETTETDVVIEDTATKAEWDKTRAALEREGVRIYVRGRLCDDPRRISCHRSGIVPGPPPRADYRKLVQPAPHDSK